MFEKKTFHGQYADWNHMLEGNPFLKCGSFSKDAGPYFRMCTDKIQSLCHFVKPPDTGIYETCFKDSTTATKSSALSTGFSTTNHQVTKPTSRQNQTKTSKEVLGEEGKDSNLGKTVGLSVGLSLAVIGGIIFVIYMFRRYKCWKSTSHGNNSKAKRPGKKSSTERVIAYVNSSYDVTPNEYSFVNKTSNKVSNDGEQCYVTEEEYDVSFNVQSNSSNTSNNIYNTMQSEAYGSTNNVSRGVHCDNVYDRTQRQETDSVYNSARQIKDLTQCDNVYNHLSEATARDDQNYYESTLNTNKFDLVTDQTYGKLK
ncbi:uncharacterized protein LOC123547099 [Mercenaria mercenaria]|uniref:uncharacterized protein LOC123547099 n=1 Tax=Mercenaria mercenaria TaxID=6596 RepID=UPI00234E4F63|nr:uncharacterized protein LOC123547099 [Mercenaria mercenaria]